MDREYQSITGALDSHIQHPSKASYTREQLKPTKNKSKAGVQRHTRTSHPTNRTPASIVISKSGRLTEHKPGKKAHSRRSSRHRSTIRHRHSTPQSTDTFRKRDMATKVEPNITFRVTLMRTDKTGYTPTIRQSEYNRRS